MKKAEKTKFKPITQKELLERINQESKRREESRRLLMSSEDFSLQECVVHLFRFFGSRSRLSALLSIIEEKGLRGKDAFSLLGQIWPSCNSVWRQTDQIRELFDDFRADAVHMMTPEEKMELEKLPEQITVYRGCYQKNLNGLSWSLCRDMAISFTTFTNYQGIGKPHLLSGKVNRKDAVLKLERGELEIFSDLVEIIDYTIIQPSLEQPKENPSKNELEIKLLACA